jgi:hypothetical protein
MVELRALQIITDLDGPKNGSETLIQTSGTKIFFIYIFARSENREMQILKIWEIFKILAENIGTFFLSASNKFR